MGLKTITPYQREILVKLSRGTDQHLLGYFKHSEHERAWLQCGLLLEEGLRLSTFFTLRERGWIERVIGYAGKVWYRGAEIYTISEKGRQKLRQQEDRARLRGARITLNRPSRKGYRS